MCNHICVCYQTDRFLFVGLWWSRSYGSCINNHLSNPCLSLLKLWVRIPLTARFTRYNIMR